MKYKPNKRRLGKKATVYWKDAISCGHWVDVTNVKNIVPIKTESIGRIVHESKDAITLAGSTNGEDVSEIICIPAGMIHKIEIIKD